MARRKYQRFRPGEWDELEDLEDQEAEFEALRSRRPSPVGRLAWLLLPSFLINLLVVYLIHPKPFTLEERLQTYELDIVHPEPPALPPSPRQKTVKKAKETHKNRRRIVRKLRRRATPGPVAQKVPSPSPKTPAPAPPSPRAGPVSDLLVMRRYNPPPKSTLGELRVNGRRLKVRRYVDGGRLVSNPSRARVAAPERAGYWSTGKAPRGDVARMTLAGLASMLTGGRRGKVCDHFKRFPSLSKNRTVHLLIDSSPSMSGHISPAEVCAISVAHSALKRGFKVAVGRFGASTICQPPTTKSHLIRNVVVNRRRIGGTLVPSTCGAHKAKGPVDLVIITDGGFMRTDIGRMLEVKQAVERARNRGLLYLVPESRFATNNKALAAFRALGFRIIAFSPS